MQERFEAELALLEDRASEYTKDYFNAKATFQSIVDNSINSELKTEAQSKLTRVTDEESKSSKVSGQ